jgi:CRP-like cAMP-binding protein
MSTALVAKLGHFTSLSLADKELLHRLGAERIRHFQAHTDVLREGDRPSDVSLMIAGWAYRYKLLPDGRRQIVAVLLPGDLCDYNISMMREMDHSIATITPVTVAGISQDAFEAATIGHPKIAQALWWEAIATSAIQCEWTVSLGQRNATERVAHLVCELFFRLRAVGLTDGHTCEFPITQTELADATGLTPVHVNRTLQELRSIHLIKLKNRRLTILQLDALMRLALFNANYLHLRHAGDYHDANI